MMNWRMTQRMAGLMGGGRRGWVCAVALALLAGAGGCDSDTRDTFPTIDTTSEDVTTPDITEEDTAGPGEIELPEGIAVPIDLREHLKDLPTGASPQVSLRTVESMEELATGPMVESRPGDWLLENERIKVFIEGLDRAMSPCPYGANIVDAQARRTDGTLSEDNTGEICMMVNVGQTFAPERFDVVRDGSDGGAAVLAASGRLELLDFLDISSMTDDYAPGLLDQVALDPETIIPVKITRYFILAPGATHVQLVTAFKNTSEQTQHMLVGHMMRGGGQGHYFNPLGDYNGWGYKSLGLENLEGSPLPFVAFWGPTGGYAYVPEPDARLRPSPDALPRGGVQAAINGVSVSLMGQANVATTLLSSAGELRSNPGMLHLEPGAIATVKHREYFGGGALSSLVDEIYTGFDIQSELITGKVVDGGGNAIEGAYVSAVNAQGQAMNQARTDAAGAYSMRLPVGAYTLRARAGRRIQRDVAQATVVADQPAQAAELVLKDATTIKVRIKTPAGDPTPGRVSLFCEGPCPDMPTHQEQDITYDPLPTGFAQVVWSDVNGGVDLQVAPGAYRVSVSRGVAWSLWPQGARADGGHLVQIDEGQTLDVAAEIAPVVDLSGVISGDFHVHGITSADSVVRPESRVQGFMGDGVDVLVSSDHDYIYDYAPVVAELGAAQQIATVVGVEITTPNIGHFNSFPIIQDITHRRNGALDWGSDSGGFNTTPAELFAWMDAQDGDSTNPQVKQINHAQGTIPPLKADVLRGISFADAAGRRMRPTTPDPVTGDTGLWSDDFNAIEIMNGPAMPNYWAIMRWWLTMISRGFSPTGTAVTDTHNLYSDLGGIPRTFVFVDPAHDTPATFNQDEFVTAITRGRAVGSNGPFFRVELVNSANEVATLGEVLAASDGDVVARVTVDVPEWMHVDTIDIYSNLDAVEIVTRPGQMITTPVPPTSTHPIAWDEATDLVEVASATQTHRHWLKTVEIPMAITADAYVVVVVRANDGEFSMWPVVPKPSVKPFAFSNPIFVDFDGDGYNNPPLKALAESAPQPLVIQKKTVPPFQGELTREALGAFIEAMTPQAEQ